MRDEREKTARANGAVGKNAITPRIVARMAQDGLTFDKAARVLDFGCGAAQAHVKALNEAGMNVVGTDLSLPEKPATLSFDVVYASNVLNVQADDGQIMGMLREVVRYLDPRSKWGGVLIVNYPVSPRKAGLSVKSMENYLRIHFIGVCRVPKGKAGANVVWCCYHPRPVR